MVALKFIKNPMFMIGVLMMFIFLWNISSENGAFSKRAELLQAHSCRAVLVKLDRRIPSSWRTKCDGNNLVVEINKTLPSLVEGVSLEQALYRELANDLMHISRNSPQDNLERTHYITVRMKYRNIQINSLTEGRFLAKLSQLTEPRIIAEHLHATVQTQIIEN